MDQFKKDISSPRLGINRSTDVRNLKGNDTTYVLNGNIESVDGDFIDYAFEKSNVLSVTFPEGYRVIGRVNRLSNNKTYYFLTNPNTGNSMFGFVDNNKQFDESNLEDNEGELPAPLEEQVQVAYNNFQILIDDSCTENGFNFNINYPIHNPLIKEEKTGGEIYFTDFRNPSRYIELDNIERYFIREVPCSEDEEVQCADFEKMRIHKRYKLPKISDVSVANGGALKKGSYTFVIALCDLQGNEISEYTSLTQPVNIWDKDDNTGQAIKLTVTDLDEDYNHYKIVAMTPSPVEVGVYSTANKEITISDLTQSKRTSIESISYVNTKVLRSEGLTVIQNSLAEYGLVFEEEMNLQPVVNLMGSFLQWQTHVATEDLYRHGDMRSKFLGFNRNEVVPYSIRFLIDGGTTTALFPLVGREATAIDREHIPLSNLDRKSFDNPTLCNQSLREERWQYYNTATVTGGCESELEGVEVTDAYTEVCTSFNTGSTGEGSLMFGKEETVYTLEDYIEDNINGCQGKLQDTNICDVLSQDYNAQCDVTFNSECSQPEKVSEVNFISEIIGESVKDVYGSGKPFENIITDPNIIPPIPSQTFADGLSYENGAVKFSNRSTPLVNPFDGSRPSTALNMQLGANMSVGRTAKSSSTSWNTTIYIGEEKSKQVNVQGHGTHTLNWVAHLIEPHFYKTTIEEPVALHVLMDKRPDRDTEGNLKESPEEFIEDDTVRVTLYNGVGIDQNPQNLIKSYLTSELEGKVITCTPENGTLKVQVTTMEGSVVDEVTLENFNTGAQLLIGVDFPIVSIPHLGPMATVNISPRASFFLYKEKVEKVGTLVSWEDIKVSTTISYKSTCTYIEPVIKSCETSKYKKGEFSYWESERLYPDNSELYDSSRLKIKGTDIPAPYRNLFSSKFSNGSSGSSTYKVKNSYNLTCKPIRHFKFPDNKISPFMTHSRVSEFGESYIYPLGVTVDENCINLLLDVAEYNGLITKGQRDSIYGYEIFRGNLTVDRTVVSSGLLYDMREYEEAGRNVKYPNYPYNSYSEDKLNLESIKNNSFGKRGSLFTFSSPETDYTGNNKGTEINIQGYQFGYSKGWFDEVQDHPKMVILSNRAYNTAEDLATTEVIAESIIGGAEALTNVGPLWIVAGTGSTGTNAEGYAVGAISAAAVTTTILVEGYLHRYATYKYQWLETFKNLGSQTNFASYYFSEGNYNYLLPLQTEGNKVRNIRFNRKLKEGRYVITDTVNKEKTEINNIDREQSVAIKVDDIIYPNEYSNYDNESLTYLGENGLESTGRSPQINKRIASPYIQVVNNNPSVHGDIDSVQWISTSYRGDLRNPRVDCLPIFGGDTFISRHTLKRKMPLFLSTLMGQANMTPFDYKFYNNIGKEPRFYVNFDVNSEFVSKGKMFPELRSEFKFDNEVSKGFYFKKPSKFYLYYYGVPSFLTETRMNTNFREFGREPGDNFYPEVGDLGWWTQEKNVPIRTPNYFKYDPQFSNQSNSFNYRTLPVEFSRRSQAIVDSSTNGVILSLQDTDENGQRNPWLKFKPLDFYEFESKYGKLKELKGIENEAVLARFKDTSIIYNKVNSTVDDGSSVSTFLGGKFVFQRRTTSFINSELGYGGSEHKESLSCEFGHFYVDNERGQIIQIPPGGGQMVEISNINSFGKSTNMKDWFKRNLPLRLPKSNIPGIEKYNSDNAFSFGGITLGYDSLHKRVLITKKDYVPLNDCIGFKQGLGFYDKCGSEIEITCPTGYTFNQVSGKCEKKVITQMCPEGFQYEPITGLCIGEGCVNRIAFIVDAFKDRGYQNLRRLIKIIEIIKNEYPTANFTWSLFLFGNQGFEENVYDETDSNVFLAYVNSIMYNVQSSDVSDFGDAFCQAVSLMDTTISELRENKYILNYITTPFTEYSPEICGVTGLNTSDIKETASYFKDSGGKVMVELRNHLSEDTEVLEETLLGEDPVPSAGFGEYGLAFYKGNADAYENAFTLFGGYENCQNINNIESDCGCYVNEQEDCECTIEVDPEYSEYNAISIDDPNYFKEISWTIAYNPQMGYFSSFMDYLPNFYVNHDRFFETGRGGLWAHNVTNKSFGVFYGDKHNFEIETISKGTLGSYMGSVELVTEARRFLNEQDFYTNENLTFNKSLIYNRKECSGELKLDLVKGSIAKYPITESIVSQRIPITSRENTFIYNYFFDRVERGVNKPFIINDENQIKISTDNISFKQKGQLARLNGDYFQNRLTYNTDSRFCLVMKLSINLTNLDNL